jgi:hypothetical protein
MEHFYQNIDGFMGYKNTAMLDIVLSKMPDNCCWVEVGAWTGKSVAYSAVELINKNKFGKFYAVDTWDGGIELKDYDIVKNNTLKDVFTQNIAPLKQMIQTIESLSWEAAINFQDESVDFCYLDAGHTYDCVIQDLVAWFPKIKTGSYFGGDDYSKEFPGLQQAVNEFFDSKNIKVEKIGRCWLIQK